MPLNCHSSGLFVDDLFFLSTKERLTNFERLAAIDKPAESNFLTQIALEKPKVFIRQIRLIQQFIKNESDPKTIANQLRQAGFYSLQIQDNLVNLLNGNLLSDPVEESEIQAVLLAINKSTQPWMSLIDAERFEDYSALECATNSIPTRLTGPSEHQYMIRIAYPNLELSLWQFDVNSAVSYPIAMVSKTTVNDYTLLDRFGMTFGRMDRATLTILTDKVSLVCARLAPAILRAFKNHQRELLLAEKQL